MNKTPKKSSLSFINDLEKQLDEGGFKRKGERTEQRLKIATAMMLEEKGYLSMRVNDITSCASVSEGTFYVYFNDKKDASVTVLKLLLENFLEELSQSQSIKESPFEEIQATNRMWISVCRSNAGLIRSVFQLADEEPDFSAQIQKNNRRWHNRVARRVSATHREINQEEALFLIYFLGAMMDDIVRRLIVYPDPYFHEVLNTLNATDEDVADAASLIWFRVLHPGAHPPKGLTGLSKKLATWITAPTLASVEAD